MTQTIKDVFYQIVFLSLFSCDQKTQNSVQFTGSSNGAYSIEQTEQVVDLYIGDCASCHGTNLRGTEGGSSLVGSGFLSKWKNKSVGDLFNYTKTTMPLSNPGVYDDETYANLVAYLLRFNKYKSGPSSLPSRLKELNKISLDELERDESMVTIMPKRIEEPIKTVEGEWLHNRSDLASTSYSPLDLINQSNAKDLKIAWRWKSDNFGPRPEFYMKTTPLMVGGIVYATAGMRRTVVAINGLTGETIWTFRLDEGERTGYVPRQNSGRGVSYWKSPDGTGDRVVYISPGYQLISLDAKTGQPIDSFGEQGVVDLKVGLGSHVDPLTSRIGSTSPPTIVNDVIVVGSCFPPGLAPPSRKQVRGDIVGYDIRTGKQLWIFHTVPQQGEFGNETWEVDSWQYTGNTGVWTPFTADEELGYVYLPVEAASGDFYGGHRPGDNLFSQSLVCLNAKTGERVWHYQITHHDLWDYDLPAPPILADINVGGKNIKAVVQVTKQAFTFVFDRVTGEPVWPIEERLVPPSSVPGEQASPTQPFPTKPIPFDRQGVTENDLIDFTPEIKRRALEIASKFQSGPLYTPLSLANPPNNLGTLMLPSLVGGANWQGGVVDPETGILYVSSTTVLTPMVLFSDPDLSDMNYVSQTVKSGVDGLGGPYGLPLAKPPWGRITAVNLNTGDHEWMIANSDTPDWAKNNPALKDLDIPRTGNPDRVGLLVTKTLLFAGEGGGLYSAPGGGGNIFRAHDKSSGEILAEIELPANQTGVPMTYSINGRQFIVVAVGDRGHPGELVALSLGN